jgi:hypothetical protein
MSKMGLYDPFGYLRHKLWLKEGPGVKLPGIIPISLRAGGMPHIVENLSTRATTLL